MTCSLLEGFLPCGMVLKVATWADCKHLLRERNELWAFQTAWNAAQGKERLTAPSVGLARLNILKVKHDTGYRRLLAITGKQAVDCQTFGPNCYAAPHQLLSAIMQGAGCQLTSQSRPAA